MACSPEQLASNKRNSLKSTGPKSTLGKEVIRGNALKHGLTGAGIAVPDEDVAVIQERFEAFEADLKPTRLSSEYLVRHLAMLSVRMERCARHDTASLTKRMLLAAQSEADLHRDDLQSLVDHMPDDPEAAYRKLQRSPRGIAWMIAQWEDLKADLADPSPHRWNSARIERAENLIGHRYSSPHLSRIGILSNAYLGNPAHLKPDDWPDLPVDDRQQAARAELARIIDGEIARLKSVLDSIDHDKLAEIESGAMARALFDASKEAVLARKYEAAAERSFFRTLKQIEHLEATAPSAVDGTENGISNYKEITSEKLALNCSEASGALATAEPALEPKKRRPPAPADRRKSRSRRARRASEATADRLPG